MKLLITGAHGQVGRALLATVPETADATGLCHSDLDISNESAVRDCVSQHQPDLIINTAAYTAVDKAESEADRASRVNVDGPRNLALAAREAGARLIHISTDFVFDGASSIAYTPQSPTNPLGVYGRTKRDGEVAVLETLPDRSVVVRTAWVYAATGSNFLRTMLRLMGANGAVRVVADQVGTPTCAKSLAEAIWALVRHPQVTGIVHWTDAGVASWYDFAVAISEEAVALGLLPTEASVTPIRTAEFPTPARRPAFSVLDKSELLSLGLASVHWRKKLRETLKECANA